VDTAWKIYEPLEQTPEEATIWKAFVPAWNAWKADHETYVALSKAYDASVDAYRKGNELYAEMTAQALVTNAVTFTAAEDLLGRLVDINTVVAGEEVKRATDDSPQKRPLPEPVLLNGSGGLGSSESPEFLDFEQYASEGWAVLGTL